PRLLPPPPTSTLFPYTTLFRSLTLGIIRFAAAIHANPPHRFGQVRAAGEAQATIAIGPQVLRRIEREAADVSQGAGHTPLPGRADRKSTRLNSIMSASRMPSSA